MTFGNSLDECCNNIKFNKNLTITRTRISCTTLVLWSRTVCGLGYCFEANCQFGMAECSFHSPPLFPLTSHSSHHLHFYFTIHD